ncbi:MAG: ATP-binding protein [Candidimonas sp.]|nr:MAG: ATP-binding protein [Candidimonas sp.]TAM19969.1 MAG: ATP-binding protein [Candidimonas sp.]TAM76417.1 MAG: ATP-binding protein [Candidimonas sp.]
MQTLASLSFAPGPDAVPKALAWLESIAKQENWHKRTAFKLILCLDEVLSNVVMYGFQDGNQDAGVACIALSILAGEQEIALDIIDNGIPFDPTLAVTRGLAESMDDAAIGGHGLRLMRHYLRDIHYRREGDKNHLRLTAIADTDKTEP